MSEYVLMKILMSGCVLIHSFKKEFDNWKKGKLCWWFFHQTDWYQNTSLNETVDILHTGVHMHTTTHQIQASNEHTLRTYYILISVTHVLLNL